MTKMVVWTILDHFGPVHFPTVLQPLPMKTLKVLNSVTFLAGHGEIHG